jgi:anti-sigma-K factor RskA
VAHLEPERLVLLALGEDALDQHETGHLDACESCHGEMVALREVADVGRQTRRVSDLPPPPEHVWQRIRAELAATGRATPPEAVTLHTDPPAHRIVPEARREPRPRNAGPGGSTRRSGPGGRPRRSGPGGRPRRAGPDGGPRRSGPGWALTAAIAVAAAVAAVAVTVTAGLLPGRGTGGDGTPAVAGCRDQDARVRLEALPEAPPGAQGYACLRTVDGELRLVVHAEGMPTPDGGDYEAWLLDSTSLDGPRLRMEALGVLGAKADQSLGVPASLDLRKYNIIDISTEPRDGDAAHSGHSVLRGRLP